MTIFDDIRNNVFSVDVFLKDGNAIECNGSAFAVSNNRAITSYHVVNFDELERVELVGIKSKPVKGFIKDYDAIADIALLQLESDLDNPTLFSYTATPPQVGSRCIWGGFPTIIGEAANRRLRFANGMVSSDSYGANKICFFEIDGMFSPGHSGSPILELKSGNLVGLVTSSAGNLYDYFYEARKYTEALKIITSKLDILYEVFRTFEDLGEYLRILESFLEKNCGVQEEAFPSISTFEEIGFRFDGKLEKRVVKVLADEEIHLTHLRSFNILDGSPVDYYQGSEPISVIFQALISLLSKWSDAVEYAIDESFQMGIGVASGGMKLQEFLNLK